MVGTEFERGLASLKGIAESARERERLLARAAAYPRGSAPPQPR